MISHPISIINQFTQAEFVQLFGDVFEQTPEIAAAAWSKRPFESKAALETAMVSEMRSLSSTKQLALIKAHPDLGSQAQMADASIQEQSSVGLNQLSQAEFNLFQQLNHEYKEKFGFPFIVAVKHHTKQSILSEFERRLKHGIQAEQATALEQIAEIARLRMEQLIE